jgi:hypothetical protein
MTRAFPLLALAALSVPAQAFIVIDTFEQGYHLATITGEGNKTNTATGLDRDKVFAGHRRTNYTVNGNPFGYTTTFEVGLGEARVTTPGPNDLSTELQISYGTGYSEPMNLDLSWYQGDGRVFEIDLDTDPNALFAEIWSVRLMDGQGRRVNSSTFGTRDGGIYFARGGFFGDVTTFNWADVDEFQFRQGWNRTRTAPLVYWTTEIRAVPEPGTALTGALLAAVFYRRRVTVAPRKPR